MLSGCHLLDGGEIRRTCEDLVGGCAEGEETGLNNSETGLDEIDVDVDGDGDGFTTEDDCDDDDHSIYPGADERCDGIDSDCDGTESSGLVTVDEVNHSTLQGAINTASEGSTVHICGGVWDEELAISQSVNLVAMSELETPLVNAQGSGSTIHITGGNVEIHGMALKGGTGSPVKIDDQQSYIVGGGIAIEAGSLLLTESLIENNSAYAGGGIYIDSDADSVEIQDSIIRANTGTSAAGGILTFSDLTLRDTTITGNGAVTGAGLYVLESEVLMDNSHVTSNIAESQYGGALIGLGNLTCQAGASITENQAEFSGGGLTLLEGSATGCLIADNESDYGAGVFFVSGNGSQLTSTVIRGNEAATAGGGMYINGTSIILEACTVEGNGAPLGAGLYVDNDDEELLISGGEFISNTARGSGGGIYYASGFLQVLSVDFGLSDLANSPDDFRDMSNFATEQSYSELGSGTSFTCEQFFSSTYICDLD